MTAQESSEYLPQESQQSLGSMSALKSGPTSPQSATDPKNIVRRKLTGYVGFANLPNQWHRKSVRKGFNFNVMVVGKFLLFSLSPFLEQSLSIPEIALRGRSDHRRSKIRATLRVEFGISLAKLSLEWPFAVA